MPIFFALVLPLLSTPAGMNNLAVKITAIIGVLFLLASTYLLLRQSRTAAQTIGVIHDALLAITMMCMCYFACVPCTEEGDKLMLALRSGRDADSVLNRKPFSFCEL
jgi:hypothetical protein